jgi:hypothetical protein
MWGSSLAMVVTALACGPIEPPGEQEARPELAQVEQSACSVISCGNLEAASTVEPDCNTRYAISAYNCGVRKRDCDGQRLTNRNAAWTESREYHPVALNGYHNIKDGGGGHMGWLNTTRVRINYGQAKNINNVQHFYVWAVSTDVGSRSGWLDYRAFSDWACLSTYFHERNHHTPANGAEQAYTLVPANNAAWLDAYGNALNIQASQPCSGSEANVTHYLARPGNLVNLSWVIPGFDLGTFSNETVRNDQNVPFYRYTSIGAISIPLYYCMNGSASQGQNSGRTLSFYYGRIGGVRGWMATPNLR